ncbi:MAG: helix-turn-helix transcriptional regulator [Nocardioides sp.]
MLTSDPTPSVPTPVVIVADHTLIGDSVAMALAHRGLVLSSLGWSHPGGARDVTPGDRGLLIADLDTERTIMRARDIVASADLHWTVLTGARRGPLWGAVLEAGASAVLSSSTSLEALSDRLLDPAPPENPQGPEREKLVASWVELWRERTDKLARLSTLSPREAQVLRLLYRGEQVAPIAQQLGVTPSTVRSQVKALLRKLGVNSQLAAVAVYAYARLEAGARSDRHPSAAATEPQRRDTVARIPNLWESAMPSGAVGVSTTTLSLEDASVFDHPEPGLARVEALRGD